MISTVLACRVLQVGTGYLRIQHQNRQLQLSPRVSQFVLQISNLALSYSPADYLQRAHSCRPLVKESSQFQLDVLSGVLATFELADDGDFERSILESKPLPPGELLDPVENVRKVLELHP